MVGRFRDTTGTGIFTLSYLEGFSMFQGQGIYIFMERLGLIDRTSGQSSRGLSPTQAVHCYLSLAQNFRWTIQKVGQTWCW